MCCWKSFCLRNSCIANNTDIAPTPPPSPFRWPQLFISVRISAHTYPPKISRVRAFSLLHRKPGSRITSNRRRHTNKRNSHCLELYKCQLIRGPLLRLLEFAGLQHHQLTLCVMGSQIMADSWASGLWQWASSSSSSSQHHRRPYMSVFSMIAKQWSNTIDSEPGICCLNIYST